MTLNGVMVVILRHFTEFGSFWANYVKVIYTLCDIIVVQEI